MTSSAVDRWPAPQLWRRILLVLAAVAGVFAMHGLSSNHSGVPSPVAVHTAMVDATSAAVGTADHTSDGLSMVANALASAGSSIDHVADAVAGTVERSHGHGGDTCLAVLSGLLLLLLLSLTRMTFGRRPHLAPAPRNAAALAARAPPPRPPSLSQLCICRT